MNKKKLNMETEPKRKVGVTASPDATSKGLTTPTLITPESVKTKRTVQGIEQHGSFKSNKGASIVTPKSLLKRSSHKLQQSAPNTDRYGVASKPRATVDDNLQEEAAAERNTNLKASAPLEGTPGAETMVKLKEKGEIKRNINLGYQKSKIGKCIFVSGYPSVIWTFITIREAIVDNSEFFTQNREDVLIVLKELNGVVSLDKDVVSQLMDNVLKANFLSFLPKEYQKTNLLIQARDCYQWRYVVGDVIEEIGEYVSSGTKSRAVEILLLPPMEMEESDNVKLQLVQGAKAAYNEYKITNNYEELKNKLAPKAKHDAAHRFSLLEAIFAIIAVIASMPKALQSTTEA